MLNILNNEKADICTPCGGKCCKTYAGIAWPEDFGATLKEELIKRLKSGKWTLDSWNATSAIPFTYFPRPAHVGYEGDLTDSLTGRMYPLK